MPAAILAGAAVVGAAATIRNGQQQAKAAKQQSLREALRQGAISQANAQAQTNAAQREQVAAQAEANNKLAQEQMNVTPDVATQAVDDNPAARRRSVRSAFRMDTVGGSGAIRV